MYKDNYHKLSVYLASSPLIKHQISMMNQEYPKIIQGYLMHRFGAGDNKYNPFSGEAQQYRKHWDLF